jgi:hypothetical protein
VDISVGINFRVFKSRASVPSKNNSATPSAVSDFPRRRKISFGSRGDPIEFEMAVPGGYTVGQGPQVTIRQIKKDSVDFVLSNVDLAYVA